LDDVYSGGIEEAQVINYLKASGLKQAIPF